MKATSVRQIMGRLAYRLALMSLFFQPSLSYALVVNAPGSDLECEAREQSELLNCWGRYWREVEVCLLNYADCRSDYGKRPFIESCETTFKNCEEGVYLERLRCAHRVREETQSCLRDVFFILHPGTRERHLSN